MNQEQRVNREKSRSSRLKHFYGITAVEYDKMLEEQEGSCAICGKTTEENGRSLSVDHNHKTGRVRGLLCGSCNYGLGSFKDDPQRLESAMYYLIVDMLESEDYLLKE